MLRPCQLVSLLGTVFLLLGEVGHDDNDETHSPHSRRSMQNRSFFPTEKKFLFRFEALVMLCMLSTVEGKLTRTSLASRYHKKNSF